MQRPIAIILALLTCSIARADDSGALDWTLARRLSWDDFAGSVPRGTDENRVAETSASLGWAYEYRLEWSRNRCLYTIVDIRTTARFHPGSSWVRPGHLTSSVLQHEQGHFDITEIYRQQFAAETHALLGLERDCRGRNDRAAARLAESEIERIIGSMYEEIWRQYRSEQAKYDAETRHGIDLTAQASWSENILTSLNASKLH